MKKIDTTQIVDPTSQQPFTGKSLKFIQDANLEVIAAAMLAQIGSSYSATTVYVLSGLTISANVIANGYVFYGGEIYTIIGADTTAYADVPVIKFQQPYDSTIDPIMFSDGVNKYVHELPQFYIDNGVSGSTAYGDYADVVFIKNRETTVVKPSAFNGTAGYLKITGSEFTGPNHKYNVKVVFECDVRVPKATDGKIAYAVNVTNDTTAGNYTETRSLAMNDTYGGTTRTFPFTFTTYITGIAAGNVLSIRGLNGQTDVHVIENIQITYELY